MADIARRAFLRHLRGAETTYVRHLRNGRTLHEGTASSFWFRPLGAVLAEVPVDDRELPLLFHAQTADFQDVSVQATVTFRLADTGIQVIGARVVAVKPEPSVAKALQTPTRERLQQGAAATFERRAVAVERERAIAENELQNQGLPRTPQPSDRPVCRCHPRRTPRTSSLLRARRRDRHRGHRVVPLDLAGTP